MRRTIAHRVVYGRVVLRKYVTPTTVIIAIGVLAFVGVIAVILASSRAPEDQPVPTVHIELRASVRAVLHFNGKTLGLAPRELVMPASSTPLTVTADLPRGRTVTKTFVPDTNQIVDVDR
jgi:hypothetical protein